MLKAISLYFPGNMQFLLTHWEILDTAVLFSTFKLSLLLCQFKVAVTVHQ